MPKYDLIEEEIKWCEAHRNPEQQVFQDGFISGLRHALFIMKSRPTPRALDSGGAWFCWRCRVTHRGDEDVTMIHANPATASNASR